MLHERFVVLLHHQYLTFLLGYFHPPKKAYISLFGSPDKARHREKTTGRKDVALQQSRGAERGRFCGHRRQRRAQGTPDAFCGFPVRKICSWSRQI